VRRANLPVRDQFFESVGLLQLGSIQLMPSISCSDLHRLGFDRRIELRPAEPIRAAVIKLLRVEPSRLDPTANRPAAEPRVDFGRLLDRQDRVVVGFGGEQPNGFRDRF